MDDLTRIKAPDYIGGILSSYLDKQKFSGLCTIEKDSALKDHILILKGSEEQRIKYPFRLGRLLDLLKEHNPADQSITLGKCTLDTLHNNFAKADGAAVILTEKEVGILTYLYEHSERKISRSELLQAVWNYAEDTETHTIETHIYRLRQKIERDPSKPEILMTDSDGGYYLGL